MAMKVPAVEIEQVPLDEDTFVTFQRPRRWEREQISRMRAQAVLEWPEGERIVRQRDIVPEDVLDSERVCLCLVDSNLCDEDGEPIFVPGKSCRQAKKSLTDRAKAGFYEKWHELPDDVAELIIQKLQDWHPPFDWRNPERGEV